MKIVFMGTPDFSVPVLEELIQAGHDVGFVITQPDRAKNRGKKIQYTPVKAKALEHHIPVLQPVRLSTDEDTWQRVRDYSPEIIVVVAYGQLLKTNYLKLPKYGCLNVHASLLPVLRGASPIQHAILQGYENTGVTIMKMEEGLDTGDMLSKAIVPINGMNFEELHDKLAAAGAELLIKTLLDLQQGKIEAKPQNDAESTYAGMISKEDGKIDFTKSADYIERQIRAFDPWPGAYCYWGEKQLKFWKASVCKEKTETASGTVVRVERNLLVVACGEDCLKVEEIQLQGKKRMEINAFLLGNSIEKGTVLK